jgi:hypothetical protein
MADVKERYQYVGCINGVYYWQGPRLPGDSRSVEVRCNREWFWSTAQREASDDSRRGDSHNTRTS